MLRRGVGLVLTIAALLGGVASPHAAGLLDPLLRFRQVRTPHFLIYFHAGEEPLASRLASIVEQVREEVAASIDSRAPALTHVILADQSEVANGWATPLPRNTVFLNAAAPSGAEFIGRTDDWLRLVFTHEFTHVVHLDQSGAWARLFRGVLGRNPIVFPNLWLPQWQIEGLATWEESTLTGEGRRTAGDFRAIERVAAASGQPLTLDRASGGLVDWPGGHAAYAAGLGFHEYLVERFGQDALGRLARSTSRRLPFLGTPAYKAVLGEPLGSLWREYQSSLAAMSPAAVGPRRLTHVGNMVSAPRFVAPRCAGCAEEIVYSAQTPHAFPSLRAVSPDGTADRQLATRYMGSTIGQTAATLVFDQQELRRDVGLYSDLYALDRSSGVVRALTRESRLQDPDLSPDGQTLAAVREHGGQRDLVLVPVNAGPTPGSVASTGDVRVIAASVDTQFGAPRWSPDGTRIAVERRRVHALPDVVIVNAHDGTIELAIGDVQGRVVTPTWRPDGKRVVAAVDFDGGPFDLYEFTLDAGGTASRLTHTDGALWPDVSPDGTTLVFAGYGVDGFDVYSVPYAPDAVGRPLASVDPRASIERSPQATQSAGYSPLPTLLPTSWTPIVVADPDQTRIGAALNGADVLARHAYAANATWLVDGPEVVRPVPAGIPDWSAAYAYTRWRPSFFAAASRETLFRLVRDTSGSQRVNVSAVQNEVQAGVFVPVVHIRWNVQTLASLVRTDLRYRLPDRDHSIDLISSRFGAAIDTTRRYGYSISREHGVYAGATTELAREALGSDADATTSTVDARVYVPGFARHHVWAVRGAAGLSRGSDLARQTFRLGNVSASSSVLDFGSDAIGLLRGVGTTIQGDRLMVGNIEYRFPLAVVERGHGTWPLLVRTLHASVFADAGQVRLDDRAQPDWIRSVGGELSVDAVAGYSLPFALTLGAAWSNSGHGARDTSTYVRIGRAF